MPKVTRDRKDSHPTPTPATRVFQTSCNRVRLRPKVDRFSTSDSSTLAFAVQVELLVRSSVSSWASQGWTQLSAPGPRHPQSSLSVNSKP